ncbi:MAG: hypothetical protein ABIR92_04470, partial [Gemmatimonadaceae bacterium]
VAVTTIVIAGIAGRMWWGGERQADGMPSSNAPGVQSIAVLPFENVGGDTAQEYFADGMTQEISSVLAKIPGLRVAGRRSAFLYKGTATPIAEIGRALGVTLALEGRVRREGNRIRVSVELSNAADGMQRWAGRWDADLRNAFDVQDSLAQAIATELRLALSGSALAASRAGRTPNPAAHDLYLRGRSLLSLGSEPELRRSIVLFQQAIAIDPSFAQAHAGVANAWAFLADAHVPASEAYPHMRDAALAALRNDSLLAEAHTMYGYALLGTDWDYETADREMRKGLNLDPNSSDVSLFYSNFLCARGRTDEGLEIGARALRLEPLSALASWNREWCFYTGHRWDDVIVQHRITAALDSTLVYLDAWQAGALREQGRLAESLKEYETAQRLAGDRPMYGRAITYARLGDTATARRLMGELEAAARREYVSADALALGWAGIGEVDRAFHWLSKAVESRSLLVTTMEWFPEYQGLRGDPRYRTLLARLKGAR